jgi:hypothetical protein
MPQLDSNESDGKGLFIIRNGQKIASYEAGEWAPLLPGVVISASRRVPDFRDLLRTQPEEGCDSGLKLGTELVILMRRRDFIKVAAGSTAAWPLASHTRNSRRRR